MSGHLFGFDRAWSVERLAGTDKTAVCWLSGEGGAVMHVVAPSKRFVFNMASLLSCSPYPMYYSVPMPATPAPLGSLLGGGLIL